MTKTGKEATSGLNDVIYQSTRHSTKMKLAAQKLEEQRIKSYSPV